MNVNHYKDSGLYGAVFAPVYDMFYPTGPEVAQAVDVLAGFAENGPVLELGVGTGRIALPLAVTGVEVHGVDGSQDMLDALALKPGADRVTATLADLRDDHGTDTYAVATFLAQTLSLLPDGTAQLQSLASAANALACGGRLIIEGYARVPEPFHKAGPALHPIVVTEDMVILAATQHDPLAQTLLIQHIVHDGASTQLLPVRFRYAWPTELDLMAQKVGLTLEHRWADWSRSELTARDDTHISVYRKLGPEAAIPATEGNRL